MISILEVGDWSRDGHNQSELYKVEHNLLSDEELQHAHDAGCAKLGFNFAEQVAAEYEEPFIAKELTERFADFGADISEYIHEWEDAHGLTFSVDGPEAFCKLWMTVAWIGRKDLRWQDVTDMSHGSIKVGGYGLYGG